MAETSLEEAQGIIHDCFRILFARYMLGDHVVDIVNLTTNGIERTRQEVQIEFKLNGYIDKEDIL